MTEKGGPTAQSGIYYQNSIAALYLGRLCDPFERPLNERINKVRVEDLEFVDDVVITFADDHKSYIQAKENIRFVGEVWEKLCDNLKKQFQSSNFTSGKDRLVLWFGQYLPDFDYLKEICKKAFNSHTIEEFESRLNENQNRLLKKLKISFFDELFDKNDLFELLKHVDVEIYTINRIEEDLVPHWIPSSSVSPKHLFRIFRDFVGGESRVRGTFLTDLVAKRLFEEDQISLKNQFSDDDLKAVIRDCTATIKQYKNTFGNTNCHIRRQITDEIIEWLCNSNSDERFSVLLDQAGMGKTVLVRDLVELLEKKEAPVLAIKADTISDIKSLDELHDVLGIPDRIKRVLGQLSLAGNVVLIIDQIDALSLSLAHDQTALNVIINLVAKVRLNPNIKILITCREFDFKTDARLVNLDVKKKFEIHKLNESEIKQVLNLVGIEYSSLTTSLKTLLQVPLHLDLFTRIVEKSGKDVIKNSITHLTQKGELDLVL